MSELSKRQYRRCNVLYEMWYCSVRHPGGPYSPIKFCLNILSWI